jgi:GntR family transcriptional regulator/MocR family aminotransferase
MLRRHRDVEALGEAAVAVDRDWHGHRVRGLKRADVLDGIIESEVDREHRDPIAVGVVRRLQVRHLFLARHAPGVPELEVDGFASEQIYVTPAHQCPLGVTMSLPRRLALLAWARKIGALVFEDDYDSEYRYSGRPIPALQGLDRTGQVVFAGSFSKVLFPSLRLGYLVVPSDLIDRFAASRSLTNRHPPMLEQMVVCDFITEGHFGRHVRRMRQLYAERLSVLIDGTRQQLAGLLDISSIEAGLQTIGWLTGGITGEAAAEAARARNVEVIPLRRFHRGAMARDGLQLGFAAVNTREIRRGISELARVLEGRGVSLRGASARQTR